MHSHKALSFTISGISTVSEVGINPIYLPPLTHTQNIIQENPFTDTLRTGSASPTLSIGEAIDGPVEKMISNPFMADPGGQQAQQWEMYRQQVRGNREWGEREGWKSGSFCRWRHICS